MYTGGEFPCELSARCASLTLAALLIKTQHIENSRQYFLDAENATILTYTTARIEILLNLDAEIPPIYEYFSDF